MNLADFEAKNFSSRKAYEMAHLKHMAYNTPLLGEQREDDEQSNVSFFSRVFEDIKIYQEDAIYQSDARVENDSYTEQATGSKITDFKDDNFRPQSPKSEKVPPLPIQSEFTLTHLDFWLYLIGMLVRIQTIVLGYICFGVETENVCIVVWESDKPLTHDQLPEDLNFLPGGFANMSRIF